MNPVLIEQILEVAKAAKQTPHGNKEKIYEEASNKLGLALITLKKKIKELTLTDKRKVRKDEGKSALTREEALIISATLMEATRKNGKRLYSIADAIEILRANNKINASRIDKNTGEMITLSTRAIINALRMYKLHPTQLIKPSSVQELASLHPNHVWQIDASLCTLYYLSNGKKSLQVMNSEQFYKNKPNNILRIASERVWSYQIVDHASGWIYVEYVLGAESGKNLCSVLINAMQDRGGNDVLHGIPKILYLDPGAANTSAMTKNLCQELNIQLLVHKPHAARSTGSVEKARDIIERKFEPGLKFCSVSSLEELNTLAKIWRIHFNATAIHSRHGLSRSAAWLKITQEQLIKAPYTEICQQLAVSKSEERVVTSKLRIALDGIEYDVSNIPGVLVGEKLIVARNTFNNNGASVIHTNKQNNKTIYELKSIQKNEFGFYKNSAVIGDNFKSLKDTDTHNNKKLIEKLVTNTTTLQLAQSARQAKILPFSGELNPYKNIDNDRLPTFLSKRGKLAHLSIQIQREQRLLNHVCAAKQLKKLFLTKGMFWGVEQYQRLKQLYPKGINPNQINQVANKIIQALWKKENIC